MHLMTVIKKEFKVINLKNTLGLILLLTIMMLICSIGQLGLIEIKYNLNEDGIINLINAINQNEFYRIELTRTIIILGLIIPNILFCFYIAVPYMLSFYYNGRKLNTITYLLITPIKLHELVFGVTVFSFLKNIISALITFLIITVIFVFLGHKIFIAGLDVWVILLLENVVIFAILSLINSILWVTNGSKMILYIFRIVTLVGLVSVMSTSMKLFLSITLCSGTLPIIIVLLSIILIFISFVILKKVDKEKLVTSFFVE